jgi:carbamoyl-phosphate synthase small subunit
MKGYQSQNQFTPVVIVLKDGAVFYGHGTGDFSKPRFAEFVFCTAMTGIEESLTDASFAKQALVSTVSHVGVTGFTGQDEESSRIWAEGLICRHLTKSPSSWRAVGDLKSWIISKGAFVIENVNTRALTSYLRDHGSQKGAVIRESHFKQLNSEELKTLLNQAPDMVGSDLTRYVTTAKDYFFTSSGGPQVTVLDFGCKTNTLRILRDLGLKVRVVPAQTTAKEILESDAHGLLLSNGPGDPAAATYIHAEIRKLFGRLPIFAICLGHQLMAHALGGKTYKMKYGHRGIHHPVNEFDLKNGQIKRTWITSQNHGFAVDFDSISSQAKLWFEHSDDHSVEGYCIPSKNFWSVQFHPEAAPGPVEGKVLFENFIDVLKDQSKSNLE